MEKPVEGVALSASRDLKLGRFCDSYQEELAASLVANSKSHDSCQSILEAVESVSDQENLEPEFLDEFLNELIFMEICQSTDRVKTAALLAKQFPGYANRIEQAISQPSLFDTVEENGETLFNRQPISQTIEFSDGDSVNDRFVDLQHLASGGLGEVYLAFDTGVKRQVAVKTLKPALIANRPFAARFLNEGSITGGLEHPGIVPIYDAGSSSNGLPYYAMRYLKGETLKDAISELFKAGPSEDFAFRQRELLQRAVNVCDAMGYAHDHQVIHRDLKPANILLGDYGETLVIDWGLAKKVTDENVDAELSFSKSNSENFLNTSGNDSATTYGHVLGTPEYMSPEQATGDPELIGTPSDVYSMGAVLYSILTGTSPIGKSAGKIEDRVAIAQRCEYPSAKSRNPKVPAALDAICRKAMHRDPDKRYRTPLKLGDDLRKWLNDLPVDAYPESVTEKGSRFFRKHRRISALAVAALVAIALVSAIAASAFNAKNIELERMGALAIEDSKLQKKLADENKEIAERERVSGLETRAQLSFMNTLYSSNRGQSNLGKATGEEIIRKVESAYSNSGMTSEAKLHFVEIGIRSLMAVGQHDKALDFHDRSEALRHEVHGSDLAESVKATADKVEMLLACRNPKDALALAIENSDSAIEHFGIEHEVTRKLLRCKHQSYGYLRMLPEANATLEELYPWLKSVEANGIPDGLELEELFFCSQYAQGLARIGQTDRALLIQDELHLKALETLGPRHPYTLDFMRRLVKDTTKFGEPIKAIGLNQDLASVYEDVLGANHELAIAVRVSVGKLLQDTGDLTAASEVFRELLEIQVQNDRSTDGLTCLLKIFLSQTYLMNGEDEKAVEMFDEVSSRFSAYSDVDKSGLEELRKQFSLDTSLAELKVLLGRAETLILKNRRVWRPYRELPGPG